MKKKEQQEKEVAIDVTTNSNNKNELVTVLYEDRRISEDELKEYYKSLYQQSSKVDNDININKNNFKTRPGIIKGAMKNVNKER